MPQEFRNQLEQVRQQFIESLPERVRHLENIWGYLRHLNWSAQGIAALQQFAQKIAESGTSYGLPELRDSARQLDGFIKELQAMGRSFGGQEYTQLEDQVKHLTQVMTASARGISHQEALALIDDSAYAEAKGKSIFLIDPDRTLAALCSAYLRRVGFQVEYFAHPQECLPRLYQEAPDAILMDPDFEHAGLQALGSLHQIKALLTQNTPIILMSGRTDVNAKLRALRAGSSDYLIKPLAMNVLIEKLLQIITQHNHTYKVMIVDDDPDMANLEAEILRYANMEVLTVQQPLHSLQQAAQFQPDLVILDMHMPDITGMELAVLLRQDPAFLLLPIIFVTADTDVTLHKNIEALGVNAVLTKPFEATELISVCEQALNHTFALKNRVARVTRNTQQPQQINRSYFFSALEEELHSGSSGPQTSALYYVSVDNLSELNQQLGKVELINLHEQFCRRLSETTGSDEQWIDISNLVACVLAGKRSLEFHRQRSEQLVRHLSVQPFIVNDESMLLEFKPGIALLNGSLPNANQALDQAEHAFEASLIPNVPVLEAALIEAPLIEPPQPALGKVAPNFAEIVFSRDLSLAFQPIISLEDSRIEHFSVLIRLRGEDGEPIAAKQFLNRINQPRQRLELDRWVLQHAVSAIADNSATREQATLFIHLAEETLQQSTFFSFAANVLRSSRLRGSERLVFMLEEHWVMNHLHQAQEISRALHDIQCGVCMTHAGENPQIEGLFDQIALDYVRLSPQLTCDGSNPKLLETLIEKMSVRGIKIIATQIENSRNLSSLWLQGVRLFEGFFIQPPDEGFHLQNDIIFAKEFVQNNSFTQ